MSEQEAKRYLIIRDVVTTSPDGTSAKHTEAKVVTIDADLHLGGTGGSSIYGDWRIIRGPAQ